MSQKGSMLDKTERQREHFNSVARRYHEARSGDNHLALKDMIWEDFFTTNDFNLPSPVSVLEAMCGFGDGVEILRKHFKKDFDYSGFDYSEKVVEGAKNELPDMNIWQEDVSSYSAKKQYDLALVLGGLHHVPDSAGPVVKELFRSLKPGGYFISLEPTNGNIIFKKIRDLIYKFNSLFDEETERGFSTFELEEFFLVNGMTKVDSVSPGLLTYIFYYNPDAFPFLNIGNPRIVRSLYRMERKFLRTRIGSFFSFATLSLWIKPE